MRTLWIVAFCFLAYAQGNTQTVTVADEVNIRNDYAYDILGQIEDNILLFRDHGRKQTISIYDENLKFKREKDLIFEKKRVRIMNVTARDSVFNIIYGYREKDTSYIRLREFDKNVIMSDSTTLEKIADKNVPRFYRYTNSEDNSKSVFFGLDNEDFLHTKVVDNNKKTMLWKTKIELGELDLRDDFRKVIVSNEGLVLFMFEKDNVSFNKDDHALTLFGILEGSLILRTVVDLSKRLTTDVQMNYNNYNGRVVLSGLFHKKKVNSSEGYFFLNKHITDYEEIETPEYIPYGLEFIAELYGKKIGKEKELDDYVIQDVVLRQDGGFILITEMDKDFSRRSAFNNAYSAQSRNMAPGLNGWTDHYNEDLVVIAIRPDGTEHWRTILYKKQFSQDDGGIFSSFFIFKTPSRLKFIYNDEIKNNNTASEYIIDPLGKYERNSLLSTDYQNLRLRFKDAIQISNNTLLVPSEKNYNLRIVKIEYEG